MNFGKEFFFQFTDTKVPKEKTQPVNANNLLNSSCPQRNIGHSVKSYLNHQLPHPTLVDAIALSREKKFQVSISHFAAQVRDAAVHLQRTGMRLLNHRAFHVGVIGVGLIPVIDNGYLWFSYAAWNTKRKPGEKSDKDCGEMKVMRAAAREGCKHLVAVSVCGRPREEDRTAVLPPCERCCELMRTPFSNLFLQETRIICVHPKNLKQPEVWSYPQLLTFDSRR